MAAIVSIGDTIAAIATAPGRGAIGIVKVSGPGALGILRRLFKPSAGNAVGDDGANHARRLCHGWICLPDSGEPIDEVLAAWMPGPRSYTGEDVVEINGHGGGQALAALLEATLAAGARLAEPGEFTRRALLNGRIDLTQAEAVADLIDARSQRAMRLAGRRLDGELGRQVEALRRAVLETRARIEAEIDFGDQLEGESDLEALGAWIGARLTPRLERWIGGYDAARGYLEGLKVAVIGRPNVGKSSLINRLAKKERVIVTDIPGTTRDVVEVAVSLGGMPVTFADTAGLHESPDPVERIGIQRTEGYLNECEMVLFVVDAAAGIQAQDHRLAEVLRQRNVLVVFNKMDLVVPRRPPERPDSWTRWPSVAISARFDETLDELEGVLAKALRKGDCDPGGDIVPNLRQRELLVECLQRLRLAASRLEKDRASELASIELDEAVKALDQVLGRWAGSDVMEQIFQRFCIGK